MKELLVRALSGILYIVLLVVSIYNPTVLLITLFVFGILCLTELKKLLNIHKIGVVYVLFVTSYGLLVYTQIQQNFKLVNNPSIILCLLSVLINVLLIRNLYSRSSSSYNVSNKIIVATLYCSCAFIYMNLIPYFKEGYYPELLLGSFIIIWTNDTFAYIVGRFLGKRKLFERISPKKTIEGFLGGVCFAIAASYVLSTYFEVLSFVQWVILGLIVSVLGTFGDLVESKMKRQAHVKDSGNIMPGHGGLLDRLDSIIFSAPFIYIFLIVLQYIL